MPTPVTGVESLEYAPINADGTMPTTGFKKIVDIRDGSLAITVPEVTTNDIRVEDKTGIRFVLPGDTDPASIAASSLDIDGEKAADLFGGTWDAATQTFLYPPQPEIKHYAWRVTSKPYQGKKFQLFIPVGAVTAGFPDPLTRTDMFAMSFTARSTTPDDGNGNPMSPWGFRYINVPPTT